jgi:hypothetical protein
MLSITNSILEYDNGLLSIFSFCNLINTKKRTNTKICWSVTMLRDGGLGELMDEDSIKW